MSVIYFTSHAKPKFVVKEENVAHVAPDLGFDSLASRRDKMTKACLSQAKCASQSLLLQKKDDTDLHTLASPACLEPSTWQQELFNIYTLLDLKTSPAQECSVMPFERSLQKS